MDESKKKLRALIMKAKGDRTMTQFAKEMGIGVSTLSRICSGQIPLSEKIMRKIVANAEPECDMTAEMFLGLGKDSNQDTKQRHSKQEAVSNAYVCFSIIINELLSAGYSLQRTPVAVEEDYFRVDSPFRIDILTDAFELWGPWSFITFFADEPSEEISFSNSTQNRISDSFLRFFYRTVAPFYLDVYLSDRVSIVFDDKKMYEQAKEICGNMHATEPTEISLILVDRELLIVVDEFILWRGYFANPSHIPVEPFKKLIEDRRNKQSE